MSLSTRRKRSQAIQRLEIDKTILESTKGQAVVLPLELPAQLPILREMADGGMSFHGPDTSATCFLEYGMVVSLMASDRSGLMASEGFTACEVRFERILQGASMDETQEDCQLVGCHFKDCLFEVVPKMSYEATLTFEQAQLTSKESSTGFSNPLAEMRFKSESEKRLNYTAYTKSHGKHVNYGQVIQLRHIKSGKFLSAKSSSSDAADSVDVCLAAGSIASHFVLLPRFKLRRKGEPVQMQDQIVIATDEKRLFLQTSSSRMDNSSSPLLVASISHSMQWRFVSFDRSDPKISSAEKFHQNVYQGFRAGQCLRLFHLETSSWLGYDSSEQNVRLDADTEAHNEHNQHLLSPDTLWEVERNCMFIGGVIHWSDHVCLRHVITGKYLAPSTTGTSSVIAQRKPQTFLLRATTHVNQRSAVAHDSVVQIQHVASTTYLHAGSATDVLDVSDGANPVAFSRIVEMTESWHDEDAFKLVSVPQVEIDDIVLLSSYRRMLKQFVHYFDTKEQPTVRSAASIHSFLLDVEAALAAMNTFAFQDTSQDHRRQFMLRKHQYIELVTRMIEVPFDAWGGPYSISYVGSYKQDPQHKVDHMKSNISMTLVGLDDGDDESKIALNIPPFNPLNEDAMRTLFRIVRASNVLLFRMFSNCKQSDAATCSKSLPVLMKLLGHGFKASAPLSHLIQEKFHLSTEFKSFSRIIRNFLDLIKTQGKSIRYLQFLVVLCSANGVAVSKIQEKICDLIFLPSQGYRDDILIQTRTTLKNEFEICIPTRRGDEWKSLKIFYDEYYYSSQHTTLAPYFYGLLQLYVALCTDRNYKCIEILKDKFPRKCLVTAVQDRKLARSIRAVLMNLLLVLHIDCDPQKPVASPNYTRIWRDVVIQIPQFDATKYSLEERNFFDDIKNMLISYLQKRKGVIIVGDLARNELTLAMMRTCQKLIDFGMWFNEFELKELVGHLVNLLDCRTDLVLMTTDSNEGHGDYTVPFFENSVQRNKNPFARQYSLDDDLYESKTLFRSAKRLSVNVSCLSSGSKLPTLESRFKQNDGNMIVMEIKDCICATLLRVDALRLDYQMSLVLAYLKERNKISDTSVSMNVSPLAQALAQRKTNLSCEFSLHVLAGRRLDTILLQTLMYEHPQLVSKALELLYLQFNQHEQLIKALSQVFILVDETTVHLYSKLQDDVDRLRHLSETTEVWMDLTTSGDFETSTRACTLLSSLKMLMQIKEGAEMTRLMTNLEVLQHVMSMIFSGSHFFNELFPSKSAGPSLSPQRPSSSSSGTLANDVLKEQQRDAIRRVYDHCMEFLFAYCELNSPKVVAEYSQVLVEFVEELPSAQALLQIVYNYELCDAIPIEIIIQFVKWSIFYKDAGESRYLQFLYDVAKTPHVQQTLLRQIVKHPQLVDIDNVEEPAYVSHILHLLSTVATTGQARDICAESFVSMARLIEFLEGILRYDDVAYGYAAVKYLKEVLLPNDDCVFKMDDVLHARLFICLRRFTITCMRKHLQSLEQSDCHDDNKLTSNDVAFEGITTLLIPVFVSYFPKFNASLMGTDDPALREWWAVWYIWLFCTVTVTTDAETEIALHTCVRWLDLLWKQPESLEELYLESSRRKTRPFLGVGLAGFRGNDQCAFDFDKSFVDILVEIQAYRAHCLKLSASDHKSPKAHFSIEMPILPLENAPSDGISTTVVRLDLTSHQQSWLPSWARKKLKRNASAVLPSMGGLPSRRSLFNVPKFGSYSEEDSSMVQDFLLYVRHHEQTKSVIRGELGNMMHSILCLEDSLKEEHFHNSNIPTVVLNFDDVASKLVSHFKMLKHAKYAKMSLVLLDVFSLTILSLESARKRHAMQEKLDNLGLTEVIVNLISQSDDFQVFDRCVGLGIAMLDGMNATVQEHFHTYFMQPEQSDFFRKFKLNFDLLTTHNNDSKKPLLQHHLSYLSPKSSDNPSSPEPMTKYQFAAKQFRFLQLLCEGHYLLNQKCMLSQVASSVNLVEASTFVVLDLYTNASWDVMALLRQVFDSLTEFCQGPCPEAQACVAHYKFIAAVNEILWRKTKSLSETPLKLLRELKASIVVTILSLLEELNFDALKYNLMKVHKYFEKTYHGAYDGNEACSRDSYLTMGFNLHILMRQLIDHQPNLADTLYPKEIDSVRETKYRQAFGFFYKRCARVEIVWPQVATGAEKGNDLIAIYFPLHPICVCLTERTKRRLLFDVSREANKLNDFFTKTHLVILEMQHQSSLRAHRWMAVLTLHLSRLKMVTFLWSLVLNLLVVVLWKVGQPLPWIVVIAGYIHVVLCLALVVGHCINDVPLLLHDGPIVTAPPIQHHHSVDIPLYFDSDVKETLRDVEALLRRVGDRPIKRRATVIAIIRAVLGDSKTLYLILLLLLAIGGVVFSLPLLFSLHVLDIVNRSTELRYVSQAIVRPGRSLLHILYLYFLTAYIFGFVGYNYFHKYFQKDSYNGCDTLWYCFLTALDEGLKNNGGVGGYLTPSRRGSDPLAYLRLGYDLLYNVGLIIILTNLSFGIIIDTFAGLRTQHKEKVDDMKDRCFICSIDGYTFNRLTKRGFSHHTHVEHNVWHYIYLLVHIRKKKFTEYNGVELYLALRMAKHDVSFFPNHRALTLEKLERELGMPVEDDSGGNETRPPSMHHLHPNETKGTADSVQQKLDDLTDMFHQLQEQQQELMAKLFPKNSPSSHRRQMSAMTPS
ncbi:Aste57867_429 [Aphanomyces stellatus]|uniref:Aste57867_429 protein n=1 Tax=Aphanomyces stellatus TaxID=120398 RepID=A0A485K6Q5_9STRA|nr:hypothetical protein As57867_000428 [Aphanomyces stellatus]VFT77654.1 Aste57867_429 [Aphanomyces stellatus]